MCCGITVNAWLLLPVSSIFAYTSNKLLSFYGIPFSAGPYFFHTTPFIPSFCKCRVPWIMVIEEWGPRADFPLHAFWLIWSHGCCRWEYVTNFTRHHCITLTFFRDPRRLFGSKSRHGLEFLCCFRTAKNFWMPIPFMYIFRSLSNKFHTIFWSLFFLHFTLHVELFFLEKGNLKFFGFKTVMERGK